MDYATFRKFVGQPTELWVVEAVWVAVQEGSPRPTIPQVAEIIRGIKGVSEDDARARIDRALAACEVTAHLDDACEWYLALDPNIAERVQRRHVYWTENPDGPRT